MVPPELLPTFIIATFLLSLAPGPDNIFVLTQSALNGPKAGILITLGLMSGLIFHTAAVALGVAALLATSYVAFTLLKVVGAVYLLYLAWQAFSATPAAIEGKRKQQPLSPLQLYRRGVIMNITNPKVSIFFLALLPQFALPSNGPVMLQIFQLGAVFIGVALMVFSAIALVTGTLGNWLRQSPHAQQNLNWMAGTVFVGLALKLLSSDL